MRTYQLLAVAAFCAAVCSSLSPVDEKKEDIRGDMKDDLLFQGFSSKQLKKITDAMKEERVKKGTVVLKKDKRSTTFYVVYSGAFDVFVDNELARTYNFTGSFGEKGLLGNGRSSATVVAKTNGILFSLDKKSFKKLVGKNVQSKDLIYEAKEYI